MSRKVIVAPTKVLPTIYINNNTPTYNLQTYHYTTTTNQVKTTSGVQYQTQTYNTTPVYYNYNQNTNNYNNYTGEIERQTYKNNQNIKIAENYGIIDQNNLQKIQLQKRPSAGMVQNYNQNINLKAIPNTNNINLNNANNVHYKVNYVKYAQPQKNTNVTNYYYTNSNISNNNNYSANNNINNYI